MDDRAERVLTFWLVAACLLIAAASLKPRLAFERVPLTIEEPEIVAAIDGAVAEPGSYPLPFRSTVADLVRAAGGLTSDADTSLVNPAAPVTTGELVIVPGRMTAAGTTRISVNTASVDDLQRLPGIGPVMAQRIVSGRPYSRLEDLLDVSGIGEKTLERLRESITL